MNDQLQKIVRTAKAMRDEQKKYFRTRDPVALRAAQTLERELDHAIEEYDNGQGHLFPSHQPLATNH